MKQIKLYTLLPTTDGSFVAVLPFLSDAPPKEAKLLFDGTPHVLFYRADKESYVWDYLNPDAIEPMKKMEKILIFEVDISSQSIRWEYWARVIQTTENPRVTLEQTR